MSTELDRQVAEKIMDGISCRTCRIGYCQAQFTCPRHGLNAWTRDYSGDIAIAFEVVDRMLKRGFLFECSMNPPEALFGMPGRAGENILAKRCAALILPEAICRAALAAMDALRNS